MHTLHYFQLSMPLACHLSMTNKKLLLLLFLIFPLLNYNCEQFTKKNEQSAPSLITTVIDLFEAGSTQLPHFG